MAKKNFMSVPDLLDTFKNSFLEGKYINQGVKNTLAGRTDKEMKALQNLAEQANKQGATVEKLFQALDAEAKSWGLDIVVSPSGRKDNTYDIIYVPKNDKRYTEGTTEAKKRFIQSLPKFNFSGIDSKGLITVNGQKTINQGMLDILQDGEKQQIVYYTMLEKLLNEQLQKFKLNSYGGEGNFRQQVKKMTDNTLSEAIRDEAIRSAKNSVNYTTRQVLQKSVVTSNFQGAVEEFKKALQGTGTDSSRSVRQGYIDMKPLLKKIVGQDYNVIQAYQRQNNGKMNIMKSAASEQIQKDLMFILSLYSQGTSVENVETELNKLAKGNLRYLKNSDSVHAIREIGKIFNTIRPDIGTSQEGSIDNFLISLVKNSDLGILGGLDDKSNRKRVQVANNLERSDTAKKILKEKEKLGNVSKKKLYTQFQLKNKLTKDDDYEYTTGFATEKEIQEAGKQVYDEILADLRKEYKDGKGKWKKGWDDKKVRRLAMQRAGLTSSAHSGGIFYSNEIAHTLDSKELKTVSVDAKDFEELVVELVAKGLTQTEAKDKASRFFLRKKLNLSNKQLANQLLDQNIDISELLTKTDGTSFYTLSTVLKKAMKGGRKIQGIDDYSLKGAGTQLDQKVIDLLFKGQKVGIIRNPEKLTQRNLSGLLEGYVRNVFDNVTDVNAFVNSLKLGKEDWIYEETTKDQKGNKVGTGRYGVKPFEFRNNTPENAQKELKKFIEYFNNSNYVPDELKNVFTYDSQGNLTIDYKRYRGKTGVAQAAIPDYGAPGEKNLNVDYRFTGAIDRGLSAVAMATGQKMDLLSEYYLGKRTRSSANKSEVIPEIVKDKNGKEQLKKRGIYNGDAEDQAAYIKWQKDLAYIQELNKWSTSRKNKYNIDDVLTNDDIIVSYGDLNQFLANYNVDNLEEYLKDDKFKNKNLDSAKIKESLERRYVDLSKFNLPSEYENGHITEQSFNESILGQILKKQKKQKKGRTVYLSSQGGFYTQSGDYVTAGPAMALPDVERFTNSFKGKNDKTYYDISEVLKPLGAIKASEAELARAKQKALDLNANAGETSEERRAKEWLSEAIVQAMGDRQAELESKNGGSNQRANKVAVGHSMFGSAIAGSIFTADDLGVKGTDDIAELISQTGFAISTEDAKSLLGIQKQNGDNIGSYLAALKANYHYLYDEIQDFEDGEKDIKEILEGATTDSQKINKLLDKLISSTTFGSKDFKKRLEAVKTKNTSGESASFRGLSSQFGRFPFSNGLDVQAGELFFDSNLDKGSIRAGIGIARGVNADYDGDKLVFHLDLTDGELIQQLAGKDFKKKDFKKLLEQKKLSADFSKRINSAVAFATVQGSLGQEINSTSSTLKAEDLNALFNQQAQETAAILSRLNKGYTGILSNNYQAVTEALYSLTPLSNNVSLKNDQSKQNFIRDMITRGVFEGFTQDAISSKKVVDRINKEHKNTDWADSTDFYSELNNIMDVFRDYRTYQDEESLSKAFKKAEKMGIFKDNDMFADRITSKIIATAQDLYTYKDKNGKEQVNIAGFAKALGLSEEEAEQLLYEYDDKGRAIKGGYFQKKDAEGKDITRGISREIVIKAALASNKALKDSTGVGIAGTIFNKAKIIPHGVDVSTNSVYKLSQGGKLYTAQELQEMEKVNPHFVKLITQYGELTEGATEASEAINTEAEAEKNKIAIAEKETLAISKGTKAYQERFDVLKALEKANKKGDKLYAPSVTSKLNEIFGNHYSDDSAYIDSIVERYKEAEKEVSLDSGLNPVLSTDEQEVFTKITNGYWKAQVGKIVDSIDQILVDANKAILADDSIKKKTRFKTYEQLDEFLKNKASDKNYEKFISLMNSKLNSGVLGAEGVKFLLGEVDSSYYNNDNIEQYKNGKGRYIVNGVTYTKDEDAREALIKANERNKILFLSSYGSAADTYKDQYITLGNKMFDSTIRTARGDINNIGAGELPLAMITKDGALQGRPDRLIYGTRKANDEGMFGEYTGIGSQGTITVYDKKVINNGKDAINPRYVAQVMQYVYMLKQLQDYIRNNGIEDVEDLETKGNTNKGIWKLYKQIYGDNVHLDPTLFEKLKNGDAIGAGFLVENAATGQTKSYQVGNTDKNNNFKLSDNPEIDKELKYNLTHGIAYDLWGDTLQKALMNAVKMDVTSVVNFNDELPLTRQQKALREYDEAITEHIRLLKELQILKNELNKTSKDSGSYLDLEQVLEEKEKEIGESKERLKKAKKEISKSGINKGKNVTYQNLNNKLNKGSKTNKEDTNAGLETAYQRRSKDLEAETAALGKIYQDNLVPLIKKRETMKLQGADEDEIKKIDQQIQDFKEGKLWSEEGKKYKKLVKDVNSWASKIKAKSGIEMPEAESDIEKLLEKLYSDPAKAEVYKDSISQYKTDAKDIETIKKQEAELRHYAKDETFTDEQREQFKEQLEALRKTREEKEELQRKLEKGFGDSSTEFSKVREDVHARKTVTDARLEKESEINYQRSKRQRAITDEQKAYQVYSTYYDRKYQVENIEQSLEQETDQTKIRYWEKELEAAKALLGISEDTVENFEGLHKGNGIDGKDSAADRYNQSIDAKAQNRAALEYQLKSNNIKNASKQQGLFSSIDQQFSNMMFSVLGGGGVYKFVAKIRQTISNLINEATQLDKTLTNLQITTGDTREDTRLLISQYSQLGRQLGATTREVANSALEWQRQGYDTAEVTDLVTSSLYLSKLGMIDTATATENLTSSLKGFKLQASESMDVVDKLTAIDLQAATSAGEIAQGLAQFANLGSLSGVNIDEAAAYVATIADVTQMSGSSAGQALKTIISRFGNVKAGAYNDLTFESSAESGETLNDVEKVLKKLDISIRDSNLSFKDFDDVLSEIAEKWDSLDNVSKKAVANAFAGVRQQEAFMTLLQNWDTYESLLETSQNSKGTAENKYEAYEESLEASKNALKTTWEELANNAQISELLISINKIGTLLGENLPKLIKFFPQLIIAIEQWKTLTGRESFVQKGLNILNKKTNLFKKDGITDFLFGDRDNPNNIIRRGIHKNKVEEQQKSRRDRLYGLINESTLSQEGQGYAQYLSLEEQKEVEKLSKKETTFEEILSAKTGKKKKGRRKKTYTFDLSGETNNNLQLSKEAIEEQKKGIEEIKKANEEAVTAQKELKQTEIIDSQSVKMTEEQATNTEKSTAQEKSTNAVEVKTAEEQAANAQKQAAQASENAANAQISAANTQTNGQSSVLNTKGMKVADYSKVNKSTADAKAAKFQTISTAFSYAANQSMAALSAYQTGGLTHTYTNSKGEESTVNSSERAHKTGRTIETVLTATIPFIGSKVGEFISEKVMSSIDATRDQVNEQTERAQERLATLQGLNSDLGTLSSLVDSMDADDIAARREAAEEVMAELYKSENTETRQLLQKYLTQIYGQQVTLNDVMEQYTSDDRQSRERAVKALEIAQKQAENEETKEGRASENYKYQQKVDDALAAYNKAVENDPDNALNKVKAATTGALTTTAVAGTGVGLAALGAGLSATGAGAVVGIPLIIAGVLAALAAAPAGLVAGNSRYEQLEADSWESYASRQDSMILDDKISFFDNMVNGDNSLSAQISKIEKDIIEGKVEDVASSKSQIAILQEQLELAKDSLDTLTDVRGYLQTQQEEDNKLVIEQALLQAGLTKSGENATSSDTVKTVQKYLMDMTNNELKAMGDEAIYEMLASAVDESQLVNMSAFIVDDQGNKVLSEQFIEMAESILKSDSEIAGVLSGESYTLEEALVNFSGKTDRFSVAKLQRFADALNTTTDGLGDFVDRVGSLTLSDLFKSTSELLDSYSDYYSLLSSITDSTKSSSEWMSKIVSQFPDLISYMSDTPTLIEKLVGKLGQLNNQLINAQYDEYSGSASFFKYTVKPGIEEVLKNSKEYSEDQIKEIMSILDSQNISTMEDMQTYFNGLDKNDVNGNALKAAYFKALENSGVQLTANAELEEYQKLVSYMVELMNEEVSALEEQKTALEDINNQREYELRLVQAKLKLENALNNKQRVYRAGVGFVYEADQSAITEAEKELKEVENEKDISAITKQINFMQGIIDKWSSIWDVRTKEATEKELAAFTQAKGWGDTIKDIKDTLFNTSSDWGGNIEDINKDSHSTSIATSNFGSTLGNFFGSNTNFDKINTRLLNFLGGESGSLTFNSLIDKLSGMQESLVDHAKKEDQTNTSTKNTVMSELQDAWNDYVKIKNNSGSTAKERNDALLTYRKKFKEASNAGYITDNKYQYYNQDNEKDENNGKNYNWGFDSNGKALDAGSFGSEESRKQGESTDLENTTHAFTLKLNGQTYHLKSNMLEEASAENLDNIWQDITSSRDLSDWNVWWHGGGSGNRYLAEALIKNKAHFWTGGTKGNYSTGGNNFTDDSSIFPGDAESGAVTNFSQYLDWLTQKGYNDLIICGAEGNKEWTWIHNGKAYALGTDFNSSSTESKWDEEYALGSLGTQSGISLINELGTEAVITPQGTITALPSKTGIVPADITENLWSLGEIAPNILSMLEHYPQDLSSQLNKTVMSTDESFNISNLNMTINADKDFDVDAFVEKIKTITQLTKHNR